MKAKALRRLGREIGVAWRYAGLELRDRRFGRQLRAVQDRTRAIRPRDILLVTCLRNELARLPAFVAHYRRLGVNHFLMIDNGSTDGFPDWAAGQEDVSVWRTEASYRASAFGMLWCNDLLRRHGTGHWCVTVDPDEFLIYPNAETRSLRALTQFLEEERRPCMHAVLIDAYGRGPLSETILGPGDDPFAVCPFFDGDGYVQRYGWGGGVWIRGGPRLRVHFRDNVDHAPALNKIPLVRWRRDYHYRMSTHDAQPLFLNRAHTPGEVSLTGALMHFKFVSSLAEKAEEEKRRREHFAGGREYDAYDKERTASFFEPGLSRRYESSMQLVALGLMSPGRWF